MVLPLLTAVRKRAVNQSVIKDKEYPEESRKSLMHRYLTWIKDLAELQRGPSSSANFSQGKKAVLLPPLPQNCLSKLVQADFTLFTEQSLQLNRYTPAGCPRRIRNLKVRQNLLFYVKQY